MNNERYNQIVDEAYENYCKSFENQSTIEQYSFDTDPMSQLMFIGKIKTISEFSEKWGLKIEERELSWEEQVQWAMKNTDVEWENLYIVEEIAKETTPKRLLTVTYKDEKIESYE